MIHSLRAFRALAGSLFLSPRPFFFLSQHTCLFRHTQVLTPPWQPASATSCLKGRQHPNWCSSRHASLSSIKHIQRDGRKWQSWKAIKQGGLGSSLRGNNIELLSEDSTWSEPDISQGVNDKDRCVFGFDGSDMQQIYVHPFVPNKWIVLNQERALGVRCHDNPHCYSEAAVMVTSKAHLPLCILIVWHSLELDKRGRNLHN